MATGFGLALCVVLWGSVLRGGLDIGLDYAGDDGACGAGKGSGDGDTSGGQSGQGQAGKIGGDAPKNTRDFARIYDPTRLGGDGQGSQLNGQVGQGQGDVVDTDNSPISAGTLRPYNEVFGTYSEAARNSLDRGDIPPALQGLIKDYFSSLEPGTDGN